MQAVDVDSDVDLAAGASHRRADGVVLVHDVVGALDGRSRSFDKFTVGVGISRSRQEPRLYGPA